MKWVRRFHLYSGLALVPFVLLYGLSGIFFNHPTIGSDLTTERLDAAALRDAGAVALPPASALAHQVLTALKQTPDGAGFTWDPDRIAGFSSTFSVQQAGEAETWFLSASADLATARLTTRPHRTSAERSLRLQLEYIDTGIDATRAAFEALLRDRSGAAESRWRRVPSLEFGLLDAEGRPHRARFDLRSGELEAEPISADRPTIGFTSLLKRMHKAHGFPDETASTRWFWALVVDTMGVAMVIWGLSGLAMWWQMKSLRRLGAVAVVVGVAASFALARGFMMA